jgi:hypothetical protein
MIQEQSDFPEELGKIYSREEINRSPLAAAKAVWKGQGFKLRKITGEPKLTV